MTHPDRIEKEVVLQAPVSRVWQALTDAGEFGAWFGVRLDGAFAEGLTVRGHLAHPDYAHLTFELTIECMDAEHCFAFRWHPYAVDPDVDYSGEPTTRVEFRLQPVAGGTRLTLVESGFERLPPSRRDIAFRMNDGGWTQQIQNIRSHVES